MQFEEERVFNDIKEMLTPIYPNIDITMETFLEYGTGTYLDMSSIEIVQFIIDIEQKYNIIIDYEDRYYTIGDTVHGILSCLANMEQATSEEKV